MSELVNREQLRRSSGLAYSVIEAAIAWARLTPAHSMAMGKKTMTLFDKASAEQAIAQYQQDQEAKKAAKETSAPPAVDIEPVLSAVDALAEQSQAADVRAVERSRQQFKQGEASAAALQELARQLFERLDRLESSLSALHATRHAAAAAPSPRAAEPAPAPAASSSPSFGARVAIVGLLASQVQLINREFGNCLDLVFLSADEISGRGARTQIQGCQSVLTMVKFTGHAAESTFKGAGVSPIRITGGMSMLRNTLTELFVKQTDKAAA